MRFARFCLILLLVAGLSGCGDNLVPSDSDRRPAVQSGSTGPSVGQNAAAFSVSDISGSTVTLASALAGRRGIVLYFTMWCPSCDEQTAQLQTMIPALPDVGFYLVDYVSGSVADAGAAALANGFTGVGFSILADTGHELQDAFQGTMGTTVVIDAAGVIRLSEDFRDGTRLQSVLAGLP
jgi:peroxiredoxin